MECEGEDGYVAARDTRARRNAARGEDALAAAVLTIMRCMWRWAMVGRVRHVPAGESQHLRFDAFRVGRI